MSDATPTQIPQRLREQAITALVPFFIDGPGGDVKEARLIAEGLLADYHAATPKELQLAAQIAASGFAMLACLRTAAAVDNLTLEHKLDFQESAIALNRSSERANRALDASRKQRGRNPAAVTSDNTKWDEGAFQRAINQALDKLTEANARFAAYMATLPVVTEVLTTGASAKAAPGIKAMEPAMPKTKMLLLSAEQMTPSVLARRLKH